MKKIIVTLGIFGLLLTGVAQAQAPAGEKKEEKKEAPAAAQSELKVEQAVIAKNVENREAVEPGETFSKDVGRVFCFAKIIGAKSETEIKMIWTHGDKGSLGAITLPVKASNWRTWSSKKIDASSVGDWKVEIKDANDNLLTTVNFKIE
jgi:hypothetical protein